MIFIFETAIPAKLKCFSVSFRVLAIAIFENLCTFAYIKPGESLKTMSNLNGGKRQNQ